jgi:hypothetical protein
MNLHDMLPAGSKSLTAILSQPVFTQLTQLDLLDAHQPDPEYHPVHKDGNERKWKKWAGLSDLPHLTHLIP